MGNQKIGFWGELESFFLSDDEARWKAMRWTILIVGLCGSFDLVVLNSSVEDVVPMMGVIMLILSIAWIGWYCLLRPHQDMETSLSRRGLLLRATATMGQIFLGLSGWRIEAHALDSDLAQAAQTNDYEKATHVFQRAKATNVRLNKKLVLTASQKFINSGQSAAWNAVMQGLNYNSYLPSPSRDWASGTTIGATEYVFPHANVLQLYRQVYQCVYPSAAPNIPEIRGIDRPDLNTSVAIGPTCVAVEGGSILLDRLYLKRAIFFDVHIVYHGGEVFLQDVAFRDCTFEFSIQPATQNLVLQILQEGPDGKISFHAPESGR